jgi:hypothetical protein
VPRDWCATVDVDHRTGLGTAGGYVGQWADHDQRRRRTLADLVLRRDTELTRLPWVGRRVRGWEPSRCAGWGCRRCTRCTGRRIGVSHEMDLALTSRLARVANAIHRPQSRTGSRDRCWGGRAGHPA